MIKNKQKIGVAIPTYQRPDFLRQLLSTIPIDMPVVVSDNGGSLPSSFIDGYPNVEFNCTNTVVPMFTNWNNAARAQNTDWICLPSDDDIYLPGAFATVKNWIDKYPDADIVVFGHNLIDEQGKIFGSWAPNESFNKPPKGFSIFKYGVPARMPSIFFRRRLFINLGGFEEKFKLTAADSDFLQRATLVGNVLFSPEIISGYRVWNGGATASKIASSEWMKEIDVWCAGVMEFDAKHSCNIYSRHFQDEIYLQNLISGIKVMSTETDRIAMIKYLLNQRFPTRARPLTYARLLVALIRPSWNRSLSKKSNRSDC